MAAAAPRPFRFAAQAFEAKSGKEWTELARRTEDLGYSTLFTTDHYFGPGSIAESSGHRPVDVAPIAAMTAAAAVTTEPARRLPRVQRRSPPAGRARQGAGHAGHALRGSPRGRPRSRVGRRRVRGARRDDGPARRAHRPPGRGRRADEGRTGAATRSPSTARTSTPTGSPACPLPVQQPHPPIFIGGGRQRILTLAGQLADIVSINFDNSAGRLGAASVASSGAAETEQKLEWVRAGAGDRFDRHRAGDRRLLRRRRRRSRPMITAMAERFGVSEEEFASHPHALLGSVDSICDTLAGATRARTASPTSRCRSATWTTSRRSSPGCDGP